MLANGITLGYNETSTDSYTILKSLKKVPDLGIEPEMVENTPLNAKNKQYEQGVGDIGDLEYTFVYGDNLTNSETRKLLTMGDAKRKVNFEQKYPDGTKYHFAGVPSFKLVGGDLNAPVELVMKLAISSDIVRVDPIGG